MMTWGRTSLQAGLTWTSACSRLSRANGSLFRNVPFLFNSGFKGIVPYEFLSQIFSCLFFFHFLSSVNKAGEVREDFPSGKDDDRVFTTQPVSTCDRSCDSVSLKCDGTLGSHQFLVVKELKHKILNCFLYFMNNLTIQNFRSLFLSSRYKSYI